MPDDVSKTAQSQVQPAPVLGSRRLFLQGAASVGSATLLAMRGATAQTPPATGPRPHGQLTPAELLINHGLNQEMRWEQMYGRGYLTPTPLFFIRSHDPVPTIDLATWRLTVEGTGVERPLALSYDELLRLPSLSVMRYLECAGNGRSFFKELLNKPAKGTQWKFGAIGVAEWTGVPLKEILQRAGLKRTAVDVMPTGLDTRRIERPLPLAKALEDDTLLVYAMNGDILTPEHGFPVRLLVPGWVGIASIKWVGRIQVSEQALAVEKNTTDYVMIGPDFPAQPPAKGPILTVQTTKSASALPWPATLSAGTQLIRGYAWSPYGKIARVDYSLDSGQTWGQATLREPNIALAGVRWDFRWQAQPGEYVLMTRATDEQGHTQPDTVPWNELGYAFWAVVRHPVRITA